MSCRAGTRELNGEYGAVHGAVVGAVYLPDRIPHRTDAPLRDVKNGHSMTNNKTYDVIEELRFPQMAAAVMDVVLQLFVLLILAKIIGGLFERFHMPKLIGEIIAGVIFINIFFVFPQPFIDLLGFGGGPGGDLDFDISFLEIMGELGIIFLLFAVGLETRFSDIKKVGKTATYVAVLGVAIPFAGGMLFLFFDNVSFEIALLIGTALFGTSTAVGVECLRSLDAMNSNEAKIIVSATIIDDILCLTLLGIIMGVIDGGGTAKMIINIIIITAFILSMFFFISKVKALATRRKHVVNKIKSMRKKPAEEGAEAAPAKNMSEFSALGLAIIVCLGLAALSTSIGLAAIVGAFLAGMMFAEFKDTVPVEHNFNIITYFMLPFFFIWVGMGVHLDALINVTILGMLGLMILIAVITKYVAGYLGAKSGKLTRDQAHLIGVSFIPRGEVGIIVATLGISRFVFDPMPEMYSVIILMAILTSIMTPPLMTHAWKKIQKSQTAIFTELFPEKGKEDM